MTLVHNAMFITVSSFHIKRNPLRINYILLKVVPPPCEDGGHHYEYSDVSVASPYFKMIVLHVHNNLCNSLLIDDVTRLN